LLISKYLGWVYADPIFCILIAGYLIYNAWQIAILSVDFLMDRELPPEDRERILAIATADPRVSDVHEMRTRSSGIHTFIQMHLVMEQDLSLFDAHAIADKVECEIREAFPRAEVLIHQDPTGLEEMHQPVGANLA